ncbi:MAG TPA: response regulator transcription factor [Candidatus Obscuribacterales bacterium]
MPNSDSIQVLAIDSDEARRRVLKQFLAAGSGVNLAGEADDGAEALAKLNESKIDVVLVDLAGHDDDAMKLAPRIKEMHPGVRVLIITASDTPDDIFAAMDAGADGYLLRGPLSQDLVMAISSVRLGTVWLDPRIARQVLDVMASAAYSEKGRILPTGLLPMPLMPDERELLNQVAGSNCVDGVCMIDADFMKKLKRFAPRTPQDSSH